ncbi:heavy metal translocating P-type ATPase [Streptomyces zinciresistens K42]|uniref:Heavy metal translocating P-type ATPase n=1 Tax=Streptomyces zinciresistens K42 TaxID=700597 RepID=G2GEL5_9ACTN|nr:heavy metal translocating P-type ATPase [Streptomyces zinciresistens K42]
MDECRDPVALRVDVSELLPAQPVPCGSCVEQVVAFLGTRPAIGTVHRSPDGTAGSERVCVHYDTAVLDADEVLDTARRAGVEVGGEHALVHKPAPVADDHDDHGHEPGDGHDHKADDGHDHKSGDGHDHAGGGHSHDHGFLGERAELIFAVASGTMYLTGLLLGIFTELGEPVSFGFYLAAYFFGGFFTVREAIATVRAGRFEVDFLMLVAAVGAASIGKWAEGAVLLFLFSLGHALEEYAMGRARKSIEALAALTPKTALVRRPGGPAEVPVDQLAIGDVVVVRPHARVPADGFVLAGTSSIDQAPVTGESLPVDKRPVDDAEAALRAPKSVAAESVVFAGTVNGSGSLDVTVTSRAQDNTLARVVALVRDAETQQSPTQQFTARFQRIFVPAVIAVVLLLLCAGLVIDEPFSDTVYRAMAVLVAASPCALAIATPSAVLSAVARAARSGVLVKGGGPLENLGKITAIAFDKTGTLTQGRPRLTDIVAVDGVDESELGATALAVERLSDHPLAQAIVRDLADRVGADAVPSAADLRAVVGRGVEADVDGDTVAIGNLALFGDLGGPQPPEDLRARVEELEKNGRTTMVVRRAGRYLGVLGVMDTPRPEAAAVIKRLRELGIRRTIMISGDNQRVADAVAAEVGVDDAWGELLPEDKVTAISRLRTQEVRTAMIGDGVNDAPAMANATVGIAMGAAGSAVALETADIALMSDDLDKLPLATGLSRRTSRIIKQNLFFSLGVVAVLLPATMLGLGIGPAVLAHEGSTLIVVANALRLLAYKEED